ncbi:urease accessory protein UreD [Rhodobacteraceae bacterium 2CG4]|uniref:Urease accessory protein UreD n=1 Tax=Halovulum marinum TaxID=2662447 RepID=A0A6L5Z0V4_9RHOB|nr:urease accessory protein UreD [Halovulum marinum]MSU90171.1 urease accessory protein UreD [Halovulum marinum]
MHAPPTDAASGPPPRPQRARGAVRLGFARRDGCTRLADLYQAGSARAMLPRSHAPHPEATLINTAGGLTGGDRFDWRVELAPGTRATLATQTAERVYRSAAGAARVDIALRVGAGAHLDWLGQETILFEGGALERRLLLDLEGDATALIVEPLVFGRAAMGETPDRLFLTDRWSLRRDARPLHEEASRIRPPMTALRGAAALGAARAVATVIYAGHDAGDRLAPARRLLSGDGGPGRDVQAAASAWDGRLVVRMMAGDAAPLRTALKRFLTGFRGLPLPRVWAM